MSGLLHCPFCGNANPHFSHVRDGAQVACGCGASMTAFNPEARVKAAAKWNRRPGPIEREKLAGVTVSDLPF